MRFPSLAGLLAALFVAGCDKPEPPPVPANPVAIELKQTTVAKLDEFIAANKGKVVMIDCWFLGCAPCVKKFPDFVALHKQHAADGLVCASLNVIEDEWDKRTEVEAFLKKNEATFAHFIYKDTPSAVEAWEKQHDAGPTPNYIVWDRAGKQVALPYPQKSEAIEKVIAELVAKK